MMLFKDMLDVCIKRGFDMTYSCTTFYMYLLLL